MQVKEALERLALAAERMERAAVMVEASAKRVPQVAVEPAVEGDPLRLWVAHQLLKPENKAFLESIKAKSLEEARRLVRDAGGKALESGEVPLPQGLIRDVFSEPAASVGRKLFQRVQVREKTGYYPMASAVSASWLTEGQAPASEAEPSFGSAQWQVNTVGLGLTMTYEAVNDFGLLVSAVRNLFDVAISQAEDAAFLVGTGTGQPKGIYTAAAADALDGTGKGIGIILTAWASLDEAWRADAVWFMNSATYAALATTQNSQGVFYMTASLSEGPATTLLGRPIYVQNALPDNVIVLGSPRGYVIFDKVSDAGAPEAGVVLTSEGKDLVSTRSVYLMAYRRLDGQPLYSASLGLRPWVVITNFLQS